ncbi:hypothetical protein [Sphingobacterium siyangense]
MQVRCRQDVCTVKAPLKGGLNVDSLCTQGGYSTELIASWYGVGVRKI